MAWIYLVLAGIFEVVWAVALKQSKNFTEIIPNIIFVVGLGLSMWLLSLALRTLPVGIGYPIWTGIGALGALVIGMIFLNESFSWPKIFFASLLIIGILGLKLVTPE